MGDLGKARLFAPAASVCLGWDLGRAAFGIHGAAPAARYSQVNSKNLASPSRKRSFSGIHGLDQHGRHEAERASCQHPAQHCWP